jgi:DNA-binding transcriptional MerR regulator
VILKVGSKVHMPKAMYSVLEVVEITELSTQVLHTWERRYGVVQPERNDQSSRVYSDKDVRRLQLLAHCTQAGHRIGKLVSLENEELKILADPPDRYESVRLGDLLSAAKELDVGVLQDVLSFHLAVLGPIRFVRHIASPLLDKIGELWAEGHISVASEHLATNTVRSLLGPALCPQRRTTKDPTALFATVCGEDHELGVLSAALVAQNAGMRAVYLGPRLPADQMVLACKTSGAMLVCLSVTQKASKRAKGEISDIASRLPDDVEIWIGGRASNSLRVDHFRITIIGDWQDFEDALQRFRVRH